MGTVSVPSSTLCLISGIANGDIFFFGQKETGAERVAMATPLRVSFCFFCDAYLWCQVSRFDCNAMLSSGISWNIPLVTCIFLVYTLA